MTDQLEQHPLAKAAIPAYDSRELAELAEDIRQNGQIFPIFTCPHPDTGEPAILTGWSRYNAAIMAGVEPWIEPLPDGVDPQERIRSEDLRRRHLSVADKKRAAAMLIQERRAEGKPDLSDRALAKKIGLSSHVQAGEVRREIDASGNGQAIHKQEDGIIPPSTGLEWINPSPPAPRIEITLKKDGTPRLPRGRKPGAKIAKESAIKGDDLIKLWNSAALGVKQEFVARIRAEIDAW